MAELAARLPASAPQEEAARALQYVRAGRTHWSSEVERGPVITGGGWHAVTVVSSFNVFASGAPTTSTFGSSQAVGSLFPALTQFPAGNATRLQLLGVTSSGNLASTIISQVVSQFGLTSATSLTLTAGTDQSSAAGDVQVSAETVSEFRARVPGPVKALLAVLDRWRIDDACATKILGAADPEFLSDLRTGVADLRTRDAQDRARLVLDIYEGVHTLVRDADAEREWIRAPRDELERKSVLDLMTEGSQLNLLRAKAFVDYVNGR